jgi:23S rRNA (cytosine1962-C5)-methyltransferase
MTQPPVLRLRKDEDRRIRAGHSWVFSNEIDIGFTPLAALEAGAIVEVHDSRGQYLGTGYGNPKSLISVRILTRDPRRRIDSDFLHDRLTSALRIREKLFPTEAYYRLVFGEGDGLPGLVVDRFGEYLVVQPGTAGIERLLDQILPQLVEILSPRGILIRADSPTRAYEGLEPYVREAHGTVPAQVVLSENGVQFEAPILEGQKTGWFFDHRLNRDRLRRYAPASRVLDVFSYIGGWGIQAAAFGAREVLCVDSSQSALEGVLRNASINGLSDRVAVDRGDAFEVLQKLASQGERFDLVILDPPAFIKRKKDMREGERAYQRLNRSGLELLAKDGVLVSASCSFHMDRDSLLRSVLRGAMQAGREMQLLEEGHQGPDHPIHPAVPETSYLKAFFLRAI